MTVKNRSSASSPPDYVYDETAEYTLVSDSNRHVATVFVSNVDLLKDVQGKTLELDGQKILCTIPRNTANATGKHRDHTPTASSESQAMSTHDRYIDARLEGIEKTLDARIEAMQRFSEQADERNRDLISRMEGQATQVEERMRVDFQKLDKRVDALHDDHKGLRKHIWGAVLTTVIGVAAIVALMQSSMEAVISEQGAWIRQNVDRADQERSENRAVLKSIQDTQDAILNRLPTAPQAENQSSETQSAEASSPSS